MRRSIIVAGVLAVAAAGWIASGRSGGETGPAAPEAAPAEPPLVSVRVREVTAVSRRREIVVSGRTEESRRVTLRARTQAPVARVLVEAGQPVAQGEVIARQDVEDRNAALAEAEALLRQREIEQKAASELAQKGFRSSILLAEANTRLDAARARVAAIEADIARTAIRAPFDGVLETRHIEPGDFLKVGDGIASVVDLDPLLAVGFVAERDVGALALDSRATVRLIDGRDVSGRLRYVSSVAEPSTRSFRIEIELPNQHRAVRAGLTSEIRLPLPAMDGHLISPAVLTLADDGRIGVRIVEGDDIVAFVPVEILGDTGAGIWIGGLDDGARLITVGHEFVKSGQRVRPVPETEDTRT